MGQDEFEHRVESILKANNEILGLSGIDVGKKIIESLVENSTKNLKFAIGISKEEITSVIKER